MRLKFIYFLITVMFLNFSFSQNENCLDFDGDDEYMDGKIDEVRIC
jgi:hypothetical protein